MDRSLVIFLVCFGYLAFSRCCDVLVARAQAKACQRQDEVSIEAAAREVH